MGKVAKGSIYARVSTETQVERGQGLDVQLKLCRDYCRKRKVQVLGEYVDEGVSGATIDRDGLQDLLAHLNGADAVIVANTSRLWREDITRALIQRELKKADKDVVAVDNPKYSLYADTPESYLINGMMELLDSYERLSLALKLKRARRQKASSGIKASGTAPLGYRWVERKADGKRQKVVEVETGEAEVVKETFNAYLRLQSIAKVVRYLSDEGKGNRRGESFKRSQVHAMLTNRFYVGELTHGDVKVRGEHKPIMSKVIFGKVQKALARNRRRK